MERQDDPTLAGDLVFLRRIPPWGDRVQWGTDGVPVASSQNFRDKDDELSVYLAAETTADAVLDGHAGFGVVQFTVQQIRDVVSEFSRPLAICRHEEEKDKGHVMICGKVTAGMANRLKSLCRWVDGKWPTKDPLP